MFLYLFMNYVQSRRHQQAAVAENDNEIVISVCFEELATSIVIDSTNETTLQAEYLLNLNNRLEIIKKYPNAGKKSFYKSNWLYNICENITYCAFGAKR